MSILALLQQALNRRPAWLLAICVIGISLFFGDAIITPAMSVLSAVEGLSLVAPGFSPFVVPTTLAIIVGLFVMQNRGTETVSTFFGPIMVVWFLALAILGLNHIGDAPRHLAAAEGLDEQLAGPGQAVLGEDETGRRLLEGRDMALARDRHDRS